MDSHENGSAPGGGPLAADIAKEAGRIGHDLNNCLGVVGGRSELVLMHLDRGNLEGIRKGVDAILGQMERMKELSDELRGLRERV